MKKMILTMVLVGSMAVTATAFAQQGYGPRGDCGQRRAMIEQLDNATKEKIEQFLVDNSELRKQLVMKRAESKALMHTDNPDPEKAARLAGELFDLKMTLKDKAKEAGVSQYVGPMMGKDGHGRGHHRQGMGYGMGGGNRS